MSKKDDAHAFRVAQAEKLFQLFQDAHGRQPSNSDELTQWIGSPEGSAVLDTHRVGGKIIP